MRRAAKSKFFYIFGGALILILGVYFLSNYSKTQTSTAVKEQVIGAGQENAGQAQAEEEKPAQQQPQKEVTKPAQETHFSDESDAGDEHDILVVEVSYDGKLFTPPLVNIRVGDIVFFKNESDKPFWPASGPHPDHNAYPAFDSKQAVNPGDTFQFAFTKAGKWTYHDHLNDSSTGTISVTN